ncbi:NaeI family type II restriction endonuclease [Brevibacterium siliguriense]|uniref:NaeI family type II restriction endonuclease n=1 Tax=Brevibacterium siliguriense TaxID=1136497 RepID=UPI0018D4A8D2|nr:NaeI family type II restriction endonuclease [Brevibacterium siliguriense]
MPLFDISALDHDDPPLAEVYGELRRWDPDGTRLAKVFRRTYDQLYDGQRTGRYRVDQLHKTEKTHFGTLIEINIQREFNIDDGEILDFKIAGHEVDCKFSHTAAWMLPTEIFDKLALVTKANDELSTWSVGLIRVTKENRRNSKNQDRKTELNALGRSRIVWLHKDAAMQPNALLRLPPAVADEIMSRPSGQARVNELLCRVTNIRISRNIIATVAQQNDYMKRVRDNGGARGALRPDGYLILSGDYTVQQNIASDLGAVVPGPGELVSLRVVPCAPNNGVEISGSWWRIADFNEPALVAAPKLPKV